MKRWRPALLPGWCRWLGADGTERWFRVRKRPDGSLGVHPTPAPARTRPHVLVLDPALPYWREVDVAPRSRRALDAVARSRFPFDLEAGWVGVARVDGAWRLQALPADALPAVDGETAAIVSAPAAPERLREALDLRLRLGAVADLRPWARPLWNPAWTAAGTGIVAAVTIVTVGSSLVRQDMVQQDRRLRTTYDEVVRAARPLIEKRRLAARMASSVGTAKRFADGAPSREWMHLADVLAMVENGRWLQAYEVKKGLVAVRLFANEASMLMADLDPAPARLETFDLPRTDRNEIEWQFDGDEFRSE
jgi:hypothetical protein